MLRGIHHPSITTADLDRLLAFYRDLLGFEEVFSFGWESGTEMSAFAGTITGVPDSTARSVLLKAGNAFLEIFEYKAPESQRTDDRALSQGGYSHICLDSDDVIADHARLAEAGIAFNAAPIDVGPMRLCYCRDPDGNFVELQQITDPQSDLVLTSVVN
ncbi:glyoxalase/bleomycin resistance/dioxygenase family protein [Paracoccus sp. S-4012]|uniref:VOC family protein n=1 Tax=Paracoccus sp. S-4012 TaxID=2665648 RepID=UPI0012B042B1|nr:VOC family protein [Paracoccus sp. S-4012]MRX51619.1 glyoxalase/bleomycin resistance/dioxygenase family protein [Paracoccus sp. S-4012]